MKFDVVVGNPPYQSDSKQQIYTDFYLLSRNIGDIVTLIFPVGWQQPKTANNLGKLNNVAIKQDPQIVFIDNRQNVFNGVTGAEWTNIIMWVRGYDNGLNGKQLIFVDGGNVTVDSLLISKSDMKKPNELFDLASLVGCVPDSSVSTVMSSLKPYGLRTDFFKNYDKYGLMQPSDIRISDSDLKIYGLLNRQQVLRYVPIDYSLPRVTDRLSKYKVFVGKAWGNWSNSYIGGSYADIIVAKPNSLSTESYLESGSFDTLDFAMYHAKYLMTRFARSLLFINKYSQDNSKGAWVSVPLQDFSEYWWTESIDSIDDHLFDKYNIPESIRRFVIDNIQQRTEDNIVIDD